MVENLPRVLENLSGETTLLTLFCLPSEEGLILNGNNLLPFQKGLGVQESKQEITKVVSLVKMVLTLPSVYSPLTS